MIEDQPSFVMYVVDSPPTISKLLKITDLNKNINFTSIVNWGIKVNLSIYVPSVVLFF